MARMLIRISLDKEGEMEVHGGDWGRREREMQVTKTGVEQIIITNFNQPQGWRDYSLCVMVGNDLYKKLS